MSYDTKALVLVPMFASNTVTVMREEEAYSFLSLVSDCGGLRGLFIGFNFLLLWDSVVGALKRITRHISNALTTIFIIENKMKQKYFYEIGKIYFYNLKKYLTII